MKKKEEEKELVVIDAEHDPFNLGSLGAGRNTIRLSGQDHHEDENSYNPFDTSKKEEN